MTNALHTVPSYCFTYLTHIEVTTLVMMGLTAFALVLIRFFCGPRAAWVGWLAVALAAFAPRFLNTGLAPDATPTSPMGHAAIALFSVIGDWCFLEAAWRLQRTDHVPRRLRAGLGVIFGALVVLSLQAKERPLLYQAADLPISLACVYAIARALFANLGTPGADLTHQAQGRWSERGVVLIRWLAQGVAVASVITYLIAYLVYILHPYFTHGGVLRLPALPEANEEHAYALCCAVAFLPKACLSFVAFVVAVREALNLGISNGTETYWAEEGPGDPILGLVRIANSLLSPASAALLWSVPGSPSERNVRFVVSPPGGVVKIEEQEVREYLDGKRDPRPVQAWAPLSDVFGFPRQPAPLGFEVLTVKYSGAEIGQLLVKTRGRALGIVDRHQIEKFIGLELAPALQARIEQDLLDVIAKRFAQTHDRDTRKAASSITSALVEIFEPSSVRLNVDLGFAPFEERTASDPPPADTVANVICPLETAESTPRLFGTVVLTIPAPLRADRATFFLVHSEPIVVALGRLVSARLLDVLRWELKECLDNLQGALADVATVDKALDLIGKSLSSFGISVFGLETEPSLPPPAFVDGGLESRFSLTPRSRGIQVTPLPGEEGRCLLSLPFGGSLRSILRLRLCRDTFANELHPGTPWRAFVERLQELVGVVLTRVHIAREVQELQKVATVAVSTGLVVHQLVNLTLAMSTTARVLVEQTCLGILLTEDADIRRLLCKHARSAKELHGLVNDLRTYSAFSSERPVPLSKILDRNERIFRDALRGRGVELVVSCAAQVREASLDVPFHIAALALANLIENAKAAIDNSGRIVIEVARCNGVIRCDVQDSGDGVEEALLERIFDMGVSTKPGSGGWGLYLTRKSLSEFGATLTLTATGPIGSTFTLMFPEK